ncbi:TYRO-like protein [Mya arenaria]|uniref:TYRO-like protein n=1 Tax=Mya arenaria TaxID=6604 RepID=A0ABY7EQR1_MYAAR|nr:TYRO-like protein [Mya arenaria]
MKLFPFFGFEYVLCMLLWIRTGECMIEHMPLPGGLQECFSRYSERTSITETVGESIASFCVGQYTWSAAREHGLPGFNISRQAYTWVQGLVTRSSLGRSKRQAVRLRIRKEYRRMSDLERATFHRAVNMLKADTTVAPNMYDALAAIHQGIMTTAAHGGPNFLGFHRVYLLMFENALRQKIPSVTVPYWDSTLDQPMFNPTRSVIFTNSFLGNPFGMVRTGPFAGWTTLSGPLIRNSGQSGQLFSSAQIARILSNVRVAQITEPNAHLNTSLEFLHNQVHIWIDGQMGSLETASHDPIFWMHHAYVDYVWELFRRNQRRFGIDPTTDYPAFVNNSMHMAAFPMGLANFRNIDGMSEVFTSSIYTYETSPSCSQRMPDCGSPYLRCVRRGFRPLCVSLGPVGEAEGGGADDALETQRLLRRRAALLRKRNALSRKIRRIRAAMLTDPRGSAFDESKIIINNAFLKKQRVPAELPNSRLPIPQNVQNTTNSIPPLDQSVSTCPALPVTQGYQNTFNMNGHSNIRQWVYVPVKIVYQRPPTFSSYSSFPIVDGEAEAEDIYSSAANPSMRNFLQMGKPASYSRCVDQESGAGRVYVTSKGLNYMGTYKEYAVVDHRLAISIATAYVAVKSPQFGASEVFLSAYDSCGRVCQPYCKLASQPDFQRCTGAFRVTSTMPRLYGANYGDAVTHLWQFKRGDYCPMMQDNNIYIQFHCSYRDTWPFGATGSGSPVSLGDRGGGGQGTHAGHPAGMAEVAPEVELEAPEVPAFPTAGTSGVSHVIPSGVQGNHHFFQVQHILYSLTFMTCYFVLQFRPHIYFLCSSRCHVGNGCVVSSGCQMCQEGKKFPCVGSCDSYATCQHGKLVPSMCSSNLWFDPAQGQCVLGHCFNNQKQWWHTGSGWK